MCLSSPLISSTVTVFISLTHALSPRRATPAYQNSEFFPSYCTSKSLNAKSYLLLLQLGLSLCPPESTIATYTKTASSSRPWISLYLVSLVIVHSCNQLKMEELLDYIAHFGHMNYMAFYSTIETSPLNHLFNNSYSHQESQSLPALTRR